jgi:hypothetical protein
MLKQRKSEKEAFEAELSYYRVFKKFLHPAFFEKSAVCKHEFGCLENCMRKMLKKFALGFGTMMLFKIIARIGKPKELLKLL